MSLEYVCIGCSKVVKKCHKNICCKVCKKYIHKKCTNLKLSELKLLDPNDWVCRLCNENVHSNSISSDIESEINDLNKSEHFKLSSTDFTKYDDMIFNPLRFDHETNGKAYNDIVDDKDIHKCSYLTPDQFIIDANTKPSKTNFLNINIRSLSKKFDALKELLKSTECKFDVIGISETHLKEKPNDLYNIDGYNIEYTNRTTRGKGGVCMYVCMYVSDNLKYKLRYDLCKANASLNRVL